MNMGSVDVKFRKIILSISLTLFMLTLTLMPLMVGAHTIESPCTVPLVKGHNNIPIGFIKVWNDADNLYVLFEIDMGSYPNYAMEESHLHVSTGSRRDSGYIITPIRRLKPTTSIPFRFPA